MTKKCLYASFAVLIVIVAAIAYVLYPYDKKENMDYENLMKAWSYLRAQIVEFPFVQQIRGVGGASGGL